MNWAMLALALLSSGCSSVERSPQSMGFRVGDRVCASPCPTTCDLVIKEFTRLRSWNSDELHWAVWTEPACAGPIGLYGPEDLRKAGP